MTIRAAVPLLLSFLLPAAAAGEVVRIHDLAPGQLAPEARLEVPSSRWCCATPTRRTRTHRW